MLKVALEEEAKTVKFDPAEDGGKARYKVLTYYQVSIGKRKNPASYSCCYSKNSYNRNICSSSSNNSNKTKT